MTKLLYIGLFIFWILAFGFIIDALTIGFWSLGVHPLIGFIITVSAVITTWLGIHASNNSDKYNLD